MYKACACVCCLPPCIWPLLLLSWISGKIHDAPWWTGIAHLHPHHQKEAKTVEKYWHHCIYHNLFWKWLIWSEFRPRMNEAFIYLSCQHFIQENSISPPVNRLPIRLICYDLLHRRAFICLEYTRSNSHNTLIYSYTPLGQCSLECHRRFWLWPRQTCSLCTCQSQLS